MKALIHDNYTKASNLIWLTLLLGLASYFVTREYYLDNGHSIDTYASDTLFGIALLTALNLFVRRGYKWTKYALATIVIVQLGVALVGILVGVRQFMVSPLNSLINLSVVIDIISNIILIKSIVLLFQIRKEPATI